MPAQGPLEDLIGFVEEQGQLMLQRPEFLVQEKAGAGLVTDLDRQLERSIRPFLSAMLPGSQVVGEEEGGQRAEWTWWLDPLDGTTNFVHGWPRSAISVALYQEDRPHWAVVHDPYQRETFWAVQGQGAWCGQQQLRVAQRACLSEALLCTGFAPDFPGQWELCKQLQSQSRGLRVSGCAALDLAYVASGRVDAFWEIDLKPWDVAAGILLVQEAGGQVLDFSGEVARVDSGNFLASHRDLCALLKERLRAIL